MWIYHDLFFATRIQINVSWSGSGSKSGPGQMIRIQQDPDPKHCYHCKYVLIRVVCIVGFMSWEGTLAHTNLNHFKKKIAWTDVSIIVDNILYTFNYVFYLISNDGETVSKSGTGRGAVPRRLRFQLLPFPSKNKRNDKMLKNKNKNSKGFN